MAHFERKKRWGILPLLFRCLISNPRIQGINTYTQHVTQTEYYEISRQHQTKRYVIFCWNSSISLVLLWTVDFFVQIMLILLCCCSTFAVYIFASRARTLSVIFYSFFAAFCFLWHKTFEPIQSNCSKTVIKRKTLRFEIGFPLTSRGAWLHCRSNVIAWREIPKCHPRENVYRVWIEKVAFVLIRLVSADSNCVSKNITRSLTVIHKRMDRILIFI